MSVEERHTFIPRLTRDAAGRVRGVLERVRTGEKILVQELGTLGPLVAQMLGAWEDDEIHRMEEEGGERKRKTKL